MMYGYHEYDPPSAEEEAAEWGGDAGVLNGYDGVIDEEGRAALAHPLARGAYIEGHRVGRLESLADSGYRLSPSRPNEPFDWAGDYYGWPHSEDGYGEWDNYEGAA